MKQLKIALLQIAPEGTLAENLKKGVEACQKAKDMGADIALFPEMWSNGYRIYDRPAEEWMREAISADMAVGITLLEQYPGGPRNTLVLYDWNGQRMFTYAKVHTCDFSVERNLTPGEEFFVADLETEAGNVKVGAMIC